MKKNESVNTTGSVALDPSKMDIRDLVEGVHMIDATCTLLRQSFGIVSLTNSLSESPMSDSELKSFANQFDLVHKTLSVMRNSLAAYVSKRPDYASSKVRSGQKS